jgi:diguanylate cyclase (GGDEF)-like protein
MFGFLPAWFAIGADETRWLYALLFVLGIGSVNLLGYASLPWGAFATLWSIGVPVLTQLALSDIPNALAMTGAGLLYMAMATVYAVLNGGELRQLSRLRHRAARDLRDREHMQELLEHQATHDGLTGLLNRDGLLRTLSSPVVNPERAMLFIDLDRFKAVNDSHGHATGDKVLLEVAARLRALTRQEDQVARLGGDEFIVVTTVGAGHGGATALADRIVRSLERPFTVDGTRIGLGASVGIALSSDNGQVTDPLELLGSADVAMYEAKTTRRSVISYDRRLARRTAARRDTEQGLTEALATPGELRLVGQPVVTLQDQVPVGVELLTRWDRPGVGAVPPDVFISAAERTDLILHLDRWALDRAAAFIATTRRGAAETVVVGVNISGRHLLSGRLADDVLAAIDHHGIDPRNFAVELTETHLAADLELASRAIKELRSHGVSVALDDFGIGFSSLGYVQGLGVDSIKIDRSIVARVDHDPRAAAIAKVVIEMANAFEIIAVAEGIERPPQAERLLALGCHIGQGSLFGLPTELPTLATRLGWQLDQPVQAGSAPV